MTLSKTAAVLAFFAAFWLQSCGQERLNKTQIDSIVKEKCLLLGLPPHDEDHRLAVLRELNSVYCNDSAVAVGLLHERLSVVDVLESSDNALPLSVHMNATKIMFFPRVPRDRSCLLTPSPPTRAQLYQGPVSVGVLVQFLNQHCESYRTPSGMLNPAGMLRDNFIQNLYKPNNPTGKCIRVNNVTRGDFFWKYLSRSRPFVIEGAVNHWSAIQKWTTGFLLEKFGHKEVHIKMTEHGNFEGVESASLWPGYSDNWIPEAVRNQLEFPDLVVVRPATAEMLFSDFLTLIMSGLNKTGVSAYLEYSSIPYYMPELENDISELPFVEGLLKRRHLNMWLSDGHTLGKLHFDPYDNLLCQVAGKKHLVLFDPHNNENLYEAHIPEALLGYDMSKNKFYRKTLLESTSMVMSPVDILEPDFDRFPRFTSTKRLECILRPGDALFMPAFWWHEVQSYPDANQHRNLAVNFWYEPLFTKEFPCPSCRLKFNSQYQHLLDEPPSLSL